MRNYFLSLEVFTVMTFGSGSFDIADNSLMNQMLGPTTSRPLVQSLHACVAIGFVLGTYFLNDIYKFPQSFSLSRDTLCMKINKNIFSLLQIVIVKNDF